jgi:hypothetical protein
MTKFKDTIYGLKKWSKNLSNLNKIINYCSYTLALLDGLGEQRNPSIVEKKFRSIQENHTRKITEAKRIYWKNRAKTRWAKLGDAKKVP